MHTIFIHPLIKINKTKKPRRKKIDRGTNTQTNRVLTRNKAAQKEKKALCLYLFSAVFLCYMMFGSGGWAQGLCVLSMQPATELWPVPEAPVPNHISQVLPGNYKRAQEGRKTEQPWAARRLCAVRVKPHGDKLLLMLSLSCPLGNTDSSREMQMKSKSPKAREEYLKTVSSIEWVKTTALWKHWVARGPDSLALSDAL